VEDRRLNLLVELLKQEAELPFGLPKLRLDSQVKFLRLEVETPFGHPKLRLGSQVKFLRLEVEHPFGLPKLGLQGPQVDRPRREAELLSSGVPAKQGEKISNNKTL
jgi:hypothetical protein